MILFILLYLLEGTIRKYIIASTALILIKYIPIAALFLRKTSFSLPYILVLIFLPVWLTIPSLGTIQFAIYDFFVIAIVPTSVYLITRLQFNPVKKIRILNLCFYGGLANSLMITAQFFVGPSHILSQTVDRAFSQHTYGPLFQKAPGIAASSSAYITIAGVIAALSLYKYQKSKRWLLHLNIFLSFLGLILNLASRSYSLGILFFYVVYFILWSFRSGKLGMLWRTITLALPISYIYSLFSGDAGFVNANRLNDLQSVTSRIPQFFALEQLRFPLPLLGGLGLGSTVNGASSNPDLLSQCRLYFHEYEFTRYICSFGMYGYALILSRLVLSFIFLKPFLKLYHSNFLVRASGIAYIAFQFALSAPFKINDVSAGLLLVALASTASIENDINE